MDDNYEVRKLKRELEDAKYDAKKNDEVWRNTFIGLFGLILLAIIFTSLGI